MIRSDFSRSDVLLRLLVAAEIKLLALGNKPVWSSYESGPAIANFVAEARVKIQNGTITRAEVSELWCIFAPTCDWDDVIGDVQLGEEIFSAIDSMYRIAIDFPDTEDE